MYEVILYEDIHGNCPIQDFISSLETQAQTNKSKRIELVQVIKCIDLLKRLGTWAGSGLTKPIDTDSDIWELRPGKNRILFLMGEHNKIILLHVFRKKTTKTPEKEKSKSKREAKDWISRYGY